MDSEDITSNKGIYNTTQNYDFNKQNLLKDFKNKKIPDAYYTDENTLDLMRAFTSNEDITSLAKIILKHIRNDQLGFLITLQKTGFSFFNYSVSQDDDELKNFNHPLLLTKIINNLKVNNKQDLIKFSNFFQNVLLIEIKDFFKSDSIDKLTMAYLFEFILTIMQHDKEPYSLTKFVLNSLQKEKLINADFLNLPDMDYFLQPKEYLTLISFFEPEKLDEYNARHQQFKFFDAFINMKKEDDVINYLQTHNISIYDIQEKIIIPCLLYRYSEDIYDNFSSIFFFTQEYGNVFHIDNKKRSDWSNLLKKIAFLINHPKTQENKFSRNDIYPLLKSMGFQPTLKECMINMFSGMNSNFREHTHLMIDTFLDGKSKSELLIEMIAELFKLQNDTKRDHDIYSVKIYDYIDVSKFTENEYYNLLLFFKKFPEKKTSSIFIESQLLELLQKKQIRQEIQHLNWMKKHRFNPTSFLSSMHSISTFLFLRSNISFYKHLIFNSSIQFDKNQKLNDHFADKKSKDFGEAEKEQIIDSLFDFIIEDYIEMKEEGESGVPLIYEAMLMYDDKQQTDKDFLKLLRKNVFPLTERQSIIVKETYLSKLKNPLFISYVEDKLLKCLIKNEDLTIRKKRL